ncbi:hypothetical protein [Castellaniella sp.]|uniref:hypothetical protein n=1 Tax=Castellaniella sp. TaxID=1955812 RepID=UPI002AFFFBC3|nr:hypothetical protein [Castellaniella sp.]
MYTTEAASQLGVSRVQFSRFINGRSGVSDAKARAMIVCNGIARAIDYWREVSD